MNQTLFEAGKSKATPAEAWSGLGPAPETILDRLGAGLLICNAKQPGFPIIQISPSFYTVMGYTDAEAMGQKLSLFYGSLTDATTARRANRALNRAEEFQGELLCYRADGRTVWCELLLCQASAEMLRPRTSLWP